MNLRRVLNLLVSFALLFQSSLAVFNGNGKSEVPLEAVPAAVSAAAPLPAPVQADMATPGPRAYDVYLPIRYKSGEEAASQPSAPVTVLHETLQASAAANSPLFIENVGQFDPHARFLVRGAKGNLFLSEDALRYSLLERPTEPVTKTAPADHHQRDQTAEDRLTRALAKSVLAKDDFVLQLWKSRTEYVPLIHERLLALDKRLFATHPPPYQQDLHMSG